MLDLAGNNYSHYLIQLSQMIDNLSS